MAPARHHTARALLIPLAVAALGITGSIAFVSHRGGGTATTDGLPGSPVSLADVDARQEAHMYYPGSAVIVKHGHSERAEFGSSPEPAYSETILASPATADTIRSWFRDHLSSDKWTCVRPLVSPVTVDILDFYQRGTREGFNVGIVNRSIAADTYNLTFPSSGTIYQIDYIINSDVRSSRPALQRC